MKYKIAVLPKVSFVALILVCSAIVQGQSVSRSTISGYVFDKSRRPVARVYVELLSDFNSVLGRVRTEDSGKYFFGGVPSGRFTIRVNPSGTDYEEQSEEVEISGVGIRGRLLADNIQKDIYLHPRRSQTEILGKKGVIFVQEVPDSAKKAYDDAINDIDAARTVEAVEKLKASLEIFPTYYSALERLYPIYIKQQKYRDAIDICNRMVAVNPRSFSGWYGLGYASNAIHDRNVAVDALRKALSLNSDSVEASLLLGLALRQVKEYAEAEKFLKQASDLSKGKSADAHWNLALLYSHNLNRPTEAATQLELYLKVRPDAANKEQVLKLIKQLRSTPTT